jgi:ATP-dependent Lon protease
MKDLIPIFPLKLVVFPLSQIPLHIFEERYKKMIAKCLEENSGFGIVTLLKKEMAKIGSYVDIVNVLNKYPNGELDIVVKGQERFFLQEVKKHKDGYLIGRIDEYSDSTNEFDKSLLSQIQTNFNSLVNKINFKLEDAFWESYQNSKLKSFKIAEKAGLNLEQRQELLTMKEENKRLNFLLEHFQNLDKKINENVITGAIIMGDGYL